LRGEKREKGKKRTEKEKEEKGGKDSGKEF